MFSSGAIQIARIRGIKIRIHFSFLLILPILALMFGRVFVSAAELAEVPPETLSGPPSAWGLGVALALFLSVLLHELAHSLYARRAGVQVQDITLLMIGGMTRISDPPRRARDEALMALAGPLASLAIAVLCLGGARLMRETATFNVSFGLFYLGSLNGFLALFNLLPAFPMDGGRILRGALTGKLGPLRATQVAASLGKAFATIFGLIGFLSFNVILLLIAAFIFLGADAESKQALLKATLGEMVVRDLMSPVPATVLDGRATVEEAASRMMAARELAIPVVSDGRAGVVTLNAIRAVPAHRRSQVPLSELMPPLDPVEPTTELWTALRRMGDAKLPFLPITEGGQLQGILKEEDILRSVQLSELSDRSVPRGSWRRREA